MKLDISIKKIICKEVEIKEIKYTKETIWKKQITSDEIIITSFDDLNYFDKINNLYTPKKEAISTFTSIYLCCIENERSTFEFPYKGGINLQSEVLFDATSEDDKKGGINGILKIPIKFLGDLLDNIKLFRDTPFAKTVVFTSHNDNNYDQEKEWDKVLKIYEEVNPECQHNNQWAYPEKPPIPPPPPPPKEKTPKII